MAANKYRDIMIFYKISVLHYAMPGLYLKKPSTNSLYHSSCHLIILCVFMNPFTKLK
jgi:hypothetical protein